MIGLLVIFLIVVVIAIAVAATRRRRSSVEDPEWLVRRGDYKRALRALDEQRTTAFKRGDVVELENMIRLANVVAERSTGRSQRKARHVAYLAHEELNLLGATESPAAPAGAQFTGRLEALKARFTRFAADLAATDTSRGGVPSRLRSLEDALRQGRQELVALRRDWESAEEAHKLALRPKPAAPTSPPLAAFEPPAPIVPVAGLRSRLEEALTRIEDMGAKAFAIAGGVVLLLGLVLLLVFAADTIFGPGGFVPEARLGLAGFASAVALATGLYVHRRFGNLYAASAAVGAGLAGWYGTVLAAAALYDFLPALGALAAAAAIAGVGMAISLRWSSELLASLALVGAMVLPAVSLIQGQRSLLGAGFVLILMAATAAVGVRRSWLILLFSGVAVSAGQILVLVADSGAGEPRHWSKLVLAALFAAVYLGAGTAYQLRRGHQLEREAALLVLPSGALVSWAVTHLLAGHDAQGAGLLVCAAAYALLGAVVIRVSRQRDLGLLLVAVSSAIGVFGLADLLSGTPLVAGWAAQAPLLAWIARRTNEPRFRLSAAAYLLLACCHLVAFDASPDRLFTAFHHPGDGALAIVLVLVSALLFAHFLPRRGNESLFGRLVRPARLASLWAAGLLGLYALSLAVLELAQALGSAGLQGDFEHGQVALALLWSSLGLAAVVSGLRLRLAPLEQAGAGLLVFTLGVAVGFDASKLSEREFSACFLALAVATLLAGYAWQRARPERGSLEAFVSVLVSAGLATAALVTLTSGDTQGLALFAEAAVYAGFCARAFAADLRDLASLLGALALGLGAAACAEFVSGIALVACGAAAACLLAWSAARLSERRLLLGSAAVLALALGYALVHEAPPRNLFVATDEPGLGAASIALCMLAAFLLARSARLQARLASLWAAGLLGLYALSLAVLELAQALGTGTVQGKFQAGEVGVSGLWATVALVFLYLGLARRTREFQIVGFVLFGVSLGKIFLFDLPNLSAVTRALSFIAVGGLLLTAGFFYQRLTQRGELEREGLQG